jgi:carbonic anhydrase
MMTMANRSPVTAWKTLKEGNERFVAGAAEHPDQSVEHRASLTSGQQPFAAILGCSDSRAPAELIFDQGLGDLFVIRTAGQVLDAAVLGSLEFGVAVLNVPLIVVLGHRSCGAIKATLATVDGGDMPGGYVRDLVERVTPSVLSGRRAGLTTPEEFEAHHATETAAQLLTRSTTIADRVAAGTLAVIGATYELADGRVLPHHHFGDIGAAA